MTHYKPSRARQAGERRISPAPAIADNSLEDDNYELTPEQEAFLNASDLAYEAWLGWETDKEMERERLMCEVTLPQVSRIERYAMMLAALKQLTDPTV